MSKAFFMLRALTKCCVHHPFCVVLLSAHALYTCRHTKRVKVIYCQATNPNPLNHRDVFSRPALRHDSLNSLLQVA
jgi:hypothetical protein